MKLLVTFCDKRLMSLEGQTVILCLRDNLFKKKKYFDSTLNYDIDILAVNAKAFSSSKNIFGNIVIRILYTQSNVWLNI